ncbi:23S rRNA (pseudouridine(1915)-N(3))-methyltransferase RlmH [Psychrobacillus sp. INOP01]|nr:23S rRNA (pseudouridine(1915)-N(3))-methyltransferase RlmH [Psychrobacillus sp. INOP01]QUG43750.1 23S rRNA (pseudouridine(1915)-N(3))-methyltransferase RlmH [Psychrobacillus sp. INOP01]
MALKIDNMSITGNSDVTILIGAKNAPDEEDISISKMDMDLGSSTLVIFEQLYRAYRILKNEPYHK